MHMRTRINRHENYVKNYAATEVFINKSVLLVKFRKCLFTFMHVVVCVIIYFYGNQNSKDSNIRQTKNLNQKQTNNTPKTTTKKPQPHCKRRQLRAKTEVFR